MMNGVGIQRNVNGACTSYSSTSSKLGMTVGPGLEGGGGLYLCTKYKVLVERLSYRAPSAIRQYFLRWRGALER